MKTTEIVKCRPLNRTAARVVSAGESYELTIAKPTRETWDAPPPQTCLLTPISVVPLIGTRQGSLTVVGYYGSDSSNHHKLLVKCDCGKYELRKAGGWRKGLAKLASLRCQFCETRERKERHYRAVERKRQRRDIEKGRYGLPTQREIWDTPPALITEMPQRVEVLIGTRRGRLVAVGCYRATGRDKRLLVRCDCGKYEERHVAYWWEGWPDDSCQVCEKNTER